MVGACAVASSAATGVLQGSRSSPSWPRSIPGPWRAAGLTASPSMGPPLLQGPTVKNIEKHCMPNFTLVQFLEIGFTNIEDFVVQLGCFHRVRISLRHVRAILMQRHFDEQHTSTSHKHIGKCFHGKFFDPVKKTISTMPNESRKEETK